MRPLVGKLGGRFNYQLGIRNWERAEIQLGCIRRCALSPDGSELSPDDANYFPHILHCATAQAYFPQKVFIVATTVTHFKSLISFLQVFRSFPRSFTFYLYERQRPNVFQTMEFLRLCNFP